MSAKFALCVPTRNPGPDWSDWLKALSAQSAMPVAALMIDSSSTDGSDRLAVDAGMELIVIAREDFNHGATRQMVVDRLSNIDIIVFLTQDALFASHDALSMLLSAFENPLVGAAYGRQLPRRGGSAIEAHARRFNYPQQGRISSIDDVARLGIKAAFISNSFAAYRRTALMEVGGFPRDVILGEDTVAAARILKAGWKVAYKADACVYHSHTYSIVQEFCRYFDLGVLHAREAWLLREFGKPEGEGTRFVRSEVSYLAKHAWHRIPEALIRTGVKYLGYRLGRLEKHLSLRTKICLSMHKGYWKNEQIPDG